MRGFVNRNLEPVITIEIADSDGSFQSHEVVLDTGFTGELALSCETIERLGLNYRDQAQNWTVATGEETPMNEYDGVVVWHGQSRPVVILQTISGSLLGTSLLSGSKIYVDMRRGGEVLIEEDWPIA